MLHELSQHDNAIFITLTYDDMHLPHANSLSKPDLQKFFKRLRKSVTKNYSPDKKIRYFACGEYGPQTERPHYHAIIYGLGLNSLDKRLIIDSWPLCDWNPYRIKKSFGLVTPHSINYVAGYIKDKLSGPMAEEIYADTCRENVFKLCSLGIGRNYVDNNANNLMTRDYITVNGVIHSLPRYYLNRLNKEVNHEHAIESECNMIEEITGLHLTHDDAYKILPADDIRRMEDTIKNSNHQKELNMQSKFNLKIKKL